MSRPEPETTEWCDEMGHIWKSRENVACVECPHCLFTFAAVHTSQIASGEGYDCPNCDGCERETVARDGQLIALASEHADSESAAYIFGCTMLGAAERAGFMPDGKEISDRNKQRQQFIGAAIQQFTSAQSEMEEEAFA